MTPPDTEAGRALLQRVFAKTATLEDLVQFAAWELADALQALPPTVPLNESAAWHASACVARAQTAVAWMADRLKQEVLK